MKKMTLKEFKEVLDKAGLGLDFWGYEGILNLLCTHEGENAKMMHAKGLHHAGRAAEERRDVIFEHLLQRGYYNDLK